MGLGVWKLVHILNRGRGTILANLFWEKKLYLAGYIANTAMSYGANRMSGTGKQYPVPDVQFWFDIIGTGPEYSVR